MVTPIRSFAFLRPATLAAYRAIALAACLLAGPGPTLATTFTVGPATGDTCDFSSIQNALDATRANPGPDVVRVAANATYTAQALKVGAQDVTIVGGFASCASATPNGVTLISGFGGGADSVLEITGAANVVLRGLRISDGDETDEGIGGGIDFEGSGTLLLENVIVSNNRAGYGGGIAFEGVGTVTLGSDVVIQNNIASNSGGGVRISGLPFAANAKLVMISPRSIVSGNEARGEEDDTGYGGGIQLVGPADATIGSPGFGNLGAIVSNRAVYGGGIALTLRDNSDDGDDALALLYSTDPDHPLRVHDNTADELGGAAYLQVNHDIGPPRTVRTFLCAWESRFDHNLAPDGAAFFVDTEFSVLQPIGAQVFLNAPGCGVAGFPPRTDAVRCAPGVACNRVDGNVVAQATGGPASGAIVEIQQDGVFHADRIAFIDNTGDDVIHGLTSDTTSGLVLENCLIADNTLAGRAIAVDLKAYIRNCTIAGNDIGLSDVLALTGDAQLFDSIVWQPGRTTIGAGSPTGDYVLTNDPASLPGFIVTSLPPRFANPARGDYRLRAASPAIDFALPEPTEPRDLDNLPRDRELANPNFDGPRDLGAYERQSIAPLVLNASMLTDLDQWDVVTPAVSAFAPGEGPPGSAGGAMSFDWSNTPVIVGRVTSRRQCIHLPAPGTYRLDGFARTTGSGPVSGQRAVLQWELRNNGGEECTNGPVTLAGDLDITTGTAWVSAAAPANILVPDAQWTRNSSLTISIVMVGTGLTAPPGMHGWFDDISLALVPTGSAIFADGFE